MNLSKKIKTLIVLSLVLMIVGIFMVGCYPLTTTTTEGTATTATETTTTQDGQASTANSLFAKYGTWVWLAVLVVAFYFLLIRPQRTRTKKAQELMSSLQRGDEVVTIGGFHGRIKDIREDALIITIASGVDVKINKSAVSKKSTESVK